MHESISRACHIDPYRPWPLCLNAWTLRSWARKRPSQKRWPKLNENMWQIIGHWNIPRDLMFAILCSMFISVTHEASKRGIAPTNLGLKVVEVSMKPWGFTRKATSGINFILPQFGKMCFSIEPTGSGRAVFYFHIFHHPRRWRWTENVFLKHWFFMKRI